MSKRHPHLQFQLKSFHFLYVEKKLLSFSSAQNCSFFKSSNSRIAATMRVQIHSIERVKKSLVDWAAAIFHRAAQNPLKNFGSAGRKSPGDSFFKDETPRDSKCVPMLLTDCALLFCAGAHRDHGLNSAPQNEVWILWAIKGTKVKKYRLSDENWIDKIT